uniref:L1 transposable element RRM domain-containing protein n=1 Tax=Pygocentrus nattereri TaxID=42514 RepID=A0AAR2K2F4_PYGNA
MLNLYYPQQKSLFLSFRTLLAQFDIDTVTIWFEMAPKSAKSSKDTENRQPASTASPTRGMSESGETVADSPPTWAKNLTTSVQGGLDNISSRLSNMEQTLAAVRTELKDFKEALSSLGETVSAHDSRIDALETALKGLERANATMQLKIDDLEGRSRRNNIRIIGIPEGTEGTRPTDFVAGLLPKLLGEENFKLPLLVDRAHRSLRPRPAEGAKPRPFIARIHLFQVKEKILQLRRSHGPLQFQGHKVLIFPDYTSSVMEKRKQFTEVLQELRNLKITHFLRYPARLHVEVDGHSRSFSELAEAKAFVSSVSKTNKDENGSSNQKGSGFLASEDVES